VVFFRFFARLFCFVLIYVDCLSIFINRLQKLEMTKEGEVRREVPSFINPFHVAGVASVVSSAAQKEESTLLQVRLPSQNWARGRDKRDARL
jgi:hypothetical protein